MMENNYLVRNSISNLTINNCILRMLRNWCNFSCASENVLGDASLFRLQICRCLVLQPWDVVLYTPDASQSPIDLVLNERYYHGWTRFAIWAIWRTLSSIRLPERCFILLMENSFHQNWSYGTWTPTDEARFCLITEIILYNKSLDPPNIISSVFF